MILIVGGSCQGKAEYAHGLMEQYQNAGLAAGNNGAGADERSLDDGNPLDSMADGRTDCWRQAPGRTCLVNFHGFLRQVMEAGLDPDAFADEVISSGTQIITMDEVGCGIVPMERSERDYREAVGRAGQRIAGEADEVYRMMCGIPVRIK